MEQIFKGKIAIVHEWFTTVGGSEKVVEQLLKVFPDADLFGLFDFLLARDRAIIGSKKIHTTFLQTIPFINRKNYRTYLPLMPLAVEQIDLSGYDLIISSCHAVSKGVITGPDQLHISYIHTPMRYAWDMQNTYLKSSGFRRIQDALARILLHYVRNWDVIAAMRPDKLLANSSFIRKRIQKIYRRNAQVIYPPIDTDYFTPLNSREDFYLAASRFVSYKRIDLIAQTFKDLPNKKLVIIGDGPELPNLKPLFGSNITWLGYQPIDVLRDYMRRCKAFIFAAKEDFGIMPLEAQACGAPVIAFGEGGATDTVRGYGCAGQTGILFDQQSVPALKDAILSFEGSNIRGDDCRANAESFSNQRFQEEIFNFVQASWNEFLNS